MDDVSLFAPTQTREEDGSLIEPRPAGLHELIISFNAHEMLGAEKIGQVIREPDSQLTGFPFSSY